MSPFRVTPASLVRQVLIISSLAILVACGGSSELDQTEDELNTNNNGNSISDGDNDGIVDTEDNCLDISNPNQTDLDTDGQGDACDDDDDGDGVLDSSDNCPLINNASQTNNDNDGNGDPCDADDDNDGINDNVDNCPLIANTNQSDQNNNNVGDLCDQTAISSNTDSDQDGVTDNIDNCINIANPNQTDSDNNNIGDACEEVTVLDSDQDGITDDVDNCINTAKPDQSDSDNNNIGDACDTSNTNLQVWQWSDIVIPQYFWNEGSSFGNGLRTDIKFDEQSIAIEGDTIRFRVNAIDPAPPSESGADYNFRSEIRTEPWNINHPLGTEHWIGWTYTFGDDYVPDPTSPITIYQNHPGVTGLSPVFELTIAKTHNHLQNEGGEIEFVNKGNDDRLNYSDLRPLAGDSIDIVVHVVYGLDTDGLLELWLNGDLYYSEMVSTVYDAQPWGGNNKWGIYHHTFNDSFEDVDSSLAIGAANVELTMGTLRFLERTPEDTDYKINAYHLVDPAQ